MAELKSQMRSLQQQWRFLFLRHTGKYDSAMLSFALIFWRFTFRLHLITLPLFSVSGFSIIFHLYAIRQRSSSLPPAQLCIPDSTYRWRSSKAVRTGIKSEEHSGSTDLCQGLTMSFVLLTMAMLDEKSPPPPLSLFNLKSFHLFINMLCAHTFE